ncbi:MAG: PqqD family protein [Acidobacteria bacterium]|nr:PqqD family protein [Acidobacteriota bacterium]
MTALPHTNPHVIATPFDNGEGVLIDLQGKRYYQLNETGWLIWQWLVHGHSTEQIVAALTTDFDVTDRHASESLNKLIHDLQQRALLVSG